MSFATFISPNLSATQTSAVSPVDLAIPQEDIQINVGSLTCPDTAVNRFMGVYRGQPAQFVEKRPLHSHTQAVTDVGAAARSEAIIRQIHQTPSHVPAAGVCQMDSAVGSRVFLVEAPYNYTGLQESVTVNSGANTPLLFKQAVEIVEDLHAKGLVHGSIGAKAFVVDPSGNLCLASFENIRVEDPNVSFFPRGDRSVGAMAIMAPELLRSLATDGVASLSRATDIYALGCFGYQLFTGIKPFSRYIHARTPAIAQTQLIAEVVDRQGRPERPEGINEDLWSMIEACWAADAANRPTASVLLQRLASLA